MLPRQLWLMVVFFYMLVPYTHVMLAAAPLYYYHIQSYYVIEETMYSWLTQSFGAIFASTGHTGE